MLHTQYTHKDSIGAATRRARERERVGEKEKTGLDCQIWLEARVTPPPEMEPPPATATCISDLPDVILAHILAAVSDTRSRNEASLVSQKWVSLERSTRSSLALRGNALRDLYMVPDCFLAVRHLDLSLLSPWGHALLSPALPPSPSDYDPRLLAHILRRSFPAVTSLTVYCRSPFTLQLLAPNWPGLTRAKLVRWHQRPPGSPPGSDLSPLFQHCPSLSALDLSDFYCWTEDVPPALEAYPAVAARLTRLDLMSRSFAEGFGCHEVGAITAACRSLVELRLACVFDPRRIGFVGDEALRAIAANCPKLSILHLVDASALSTARGDPENDGSDAGEAGFSRATLIDFLAALPLLEDLWLDVCRNVRESSLALEVLQPSRCPNLTSLKLGQLQGICLAIGSQLDGVAVCSRLQSLSIKNSADLTDMGLIAIAKGCSRLVKFEVQGCKNVTVKGIRTMACLLCNTLVDVRISCCNNLDAASSLQAVEPIQGRIQRFHMDCVAKGSFDFDIAQLEEEAALQKMGFLESGSDNWETSSRKRCKTGVDAHGFYMGSNNEGSGSGFRCKTWDRLQCLSLWVPVGGLLLPIAVAGLNDCPRLEEIRIKVEGDCRGRLPDSAFGLSSLSIYPSLRKMQLDCGDATGNALTAPSGQMDLSLWERFYLSGIERLNLVELDYWVPQDRDLNQRGLSLPAAGLLAQCNTLRKLFIHGTAHEHFMNFFLQIQNLRDVQLRADYYPAPDNDMSTEMRVDSWSRFEDALNNRWTQNSRWFTDTQY